MRRILLAFVTVVGVSFPAFAADWPQWRGPDRTGISGDTGLLQEWPKEGPKLRWKITDLGTGYSSPAVVKGVVYIQTTRKGEEFAVALDEKTGKEFWATKLGKVGANRGPQYPGTRATPTVDGEKIYALRPWSAQVPKAVQCLVEHLRSSFSHGFSHTDPGS